MCVLVAFYTKASGPVEQRLLVCVMACRDAPTCARGYDPETIHVGGVTTAALARRAGAGWLRGVARCARNSEDSEGGER